mmetsp:Transcript_5978/g.13158  ORF Transcript_5978/g.13158 Transcript_5978/m.13158 type:complete len:334 (-) Transcript_5978:172-1173(-)
MAVPSPGTTGSLEGQGDMDVTVLAFAQWVSEMKNRQHTSQHQMQAEMSIIRNAIAANNTDLTDFKRHGATIQQQMQSEIGEIRESLSSVFMEITAAVRSNAAADQDIKLKIQSLNEQAVRNETAFAQLADAADQSQTKLRNAVQELQTSSERMREDLLRLTRTTDTLESSLNEQADGLSMKLDQLGQDHHVQLERRKEQLRKMVGDVMLIGESLQSLVSDFGEQKRSSSEMQNKLRAALAAADERRKQQAVVSGEGSLRTYPPSAGLALADPTKVAKVQPQPAAPATVPTMAPTQPPTQPQMAAAPQRPMSVNMPVAGLVREPVASAPQLVYR